MISKNHIRIIILLSASISFAAMAHCAEEGRRNTPIVKVVKEWSPSVVNISTEKMAMVQHPPFWGDYRSQLNDFFNQYARGGISAMKLKGLGSGVIVSGDGLIVTNAHVVSMASKVYVILSDGSSYEAELMAISQRDDLALIKITPSRELRSVQFADDVMIGETVVSIGNPFGLENSVSSGIVSGVNRKIYSTVSGEVVFDDLIQTDASINLGSSGGALLNLDGKLVGINLAMIQSAQNLGFVIPGGKIKKILKDYAEAVKTRKVIKIPVE